MIADRATYLAERREDKPGFQQVVARPREKYMSWSWSRAFLSANRRTAELI